MASVDAPFVEKALLLLDDPSLAEQEFSWYRRGKTGFLHGNRRCWKVHDVHATTLVRLPLRTAVGMRGCPQCFSAAVDSHSLDEAVALRSVQLDLADAQEALDEGTPPHVSMALDLAKACLAALSEDGMGESCRRAHEELTGIAQALLRTASERMSASAESVLVRAAADLECVFAGRGEGFSSAIGVWSLAPGVDLEHAVRFGTHGAAALAEAYAQWRGLIEDGISVDIAASAAVESIVAHTQLRDASQLSGVPLGEWLMPDTHDAFTAASLAWQNQLRSDAESIVAKWSAWFTENLAAREPVTLGVIKRWNNDLGDDEVSAALRAFPHAARDRVLVGTYPLVIWWYLRGLIEDRVERATEPALDPAVWETASALWEPRGTGPYQSLSATVEAAAALLR